MRNQIVDSLYNGILKDTAEQYSEIIERFMEKYPTGKEITPEIFICCSILRSINFKTINFYVIKIIKFKF